MSEEVIVNCPTCKKLVIWKKENLYRPFCCNRCQLVDLNRWMNEEQPIRSSNLSEE